MLRPSDCSKLRTEQGTWQNSDSLRLFVFFVCVGFQQFAGQDFLSCSCETRNRLFAKVTPNIRIQFKHPARSTITRVFFFLQMEEIVFGARRHDPAIDVGVLIDGGAACMMRRMTLNTGHE